MPSRAAPRSFFLAYKRTGSLSFAATHLASLPLVAMERQSCNREAVLSPRILSYHLFFLLLETFGLNKERCCRLSPFCGSIHLRRKRKTNDFLSVLRSLALCTIIHTHTHSHTLTQTGSQTGSQTMKSTPSLVLFFWPCLRSRGPGPCVSVRHNDTVVLFETKGTDTACKLIKEHELILRTKVCIAAHSIDSMASQISIASKGGIEACHQLREGKR